MKKNHPKNENRTFKIILVASALAILLFFSGLLSGLYATKIINEKQNEDRAFLIESVERLENDLGSYQLQERFLNSLEAEEVCPLAEAYFSNSAQTLSFYWNALPKRLEEYERNRELSQDYIELKKKYMDLNLRGWIIARTNSQKCTSDIIPVLYLYTSECEICVEQGEALDEARIRLELENKSMVVYTIDSNISEPALDLIKQYYSINTVPALVINDKALQGELFSPIQITAAAKETENR